jgi:HSP20 family protein
MNLTKHDPFSLLSAEIQRALAGRFDRWLSENDGSAFTSEWSPAVDIKEEDDRYVVRADVPGVDPKDIEVTLDNDVLSISGKREEEKKEEREGYRRIERVSGQFCRRFTLPEAVNAEKITAKSDKGVLEVVIPKTEKRKARRISVA